MATELLIVEGKRLIYSCGMIIGVKIHGIMMRRFRIGRSLFVRIVHDDERHDNSFKQRYDALGKYGLSSLQKSQSYLEY